MQRIIKIVCYLVFGVAAVIFGILFFRDYHQLMDTRIDSKASDLTAVKVPEYQEPPPATGKYARMMTYGALFFGSVVGLGIVLAHDLSLLVAHRFGKTLYHGDGEGFKTSEYELAEEAWANGNPLEAIQMMRDYLKNNPREQHVALRIAEIYEKDLSNPLAAALEYEEVLTQKLPAEQWGWTAIHLCNLYNNKLNQPDKANALLQRLVAEYGQTAAAAKARKRLGIPDEGPEADDANGDEDEDTFFSRARKAQNAGSDELHHHFKRFHEPPGAPPTPKSDGRPNQGLS